MFTTTFVFRFLSLGLGLHFLGFCGVIVVQIIMSNFQKESDWWEGADGKWYPPVAKKIEVDSVAESEVSIPTREGWKSRKRIYLSGVAAIVLLAAGVLVYQARKPEFVWTYLRLELIDSEKDSGGWDVRPDCENKGKYALETSPCQCELDRGYSDLYEGTPIVVYGSDGKEVGRDVLDQESFIHIGDSRSVRQNAEYDIKKGRKCIWDVNVEIPDNEEYYVIEISNRGEIKYDFEQITTFGVTMTIEDD